MRTLFEILPSSFDPENCSLLCEVSNEGFSFFIKNEESNSFVGFGVYHYDKKKPAIGFPIALQIIFHQKEILSKKFKNIGLVYSFPESVLVPFSLYEREKNQVLMNMMFGDLNQEDVLLTDVISERSMYNCYRIPGSLAEVIQNQFPNAVSTHQYSLLLKTTAEGSDQLTLIFYTQKVVVCFKTGEAYQLVNSFCYEAPEDVSYNLLNVCQQLKIEDPPVVVHGLIEENSPLFKEIYKYFSQISFAPLPVENFYTDEISKFPSHYFSHIFAIDSCE
ncbi:MAG: DUF3822 family protein [Ginsengibacter sp.]